MFHIVGYLALLLLPGSAITDQGETSQKGPNIKDREAILAMAGTYAIHFHFEETVGFPANYEITDPYDANALEVVIIDEETESRIVLQHVLQTKRGIIKHWRQDWLFENKALWEFQGDRTWRKRELSDEEARGTWTQRVFQVDDSPRYESVGQWQHHNGVSQWESEITNRPLPRREYTKRDDYDILVARNRQAITATGWVHEQDNYKLRQREGTSQILARESGVNTYRRTDQSKCADARQWWREHRPFWVQVRGEWDTIFANQSLVQLAPTIDDKPMYRHFFDLDKAWAAKSLQSEAPIASQIHQILTQFKVEKSDPIPAKTAAVQ